MHKLNVYRASAGSGKTFTLAVEYIRLLIENPYNYKNILAVTFTNKATSEMKERIITKLHALSVADGSANDYLQVIQEKFKQENLIYSDKTIQERASKALELIIHDYSHFRIETIDSFFQSIIRQLARELNLTANLHLDLDQAEVLKEAIQSMISTIKEEPVLHNAILSYINDNISENNNWQITSQMEQFSVHIFNEKYLKSKHLMHKTDNIFQFIEFKKNLIKQKEELLNDNQKNAQAFMDICNTKGFNCEDFIGKSRGIYPFFEKISKGLEVNITKTIRNFVDSPMSKDPKIQESESIFSELLIKIIKNQELLNDIDLCKANINKTMLLSSIDNKVRKLNEEANRFLLADTAYFLRQLIDESDVPFIYEKAGTTFKYIMIDEFQDTSELQWENFCPLISNSIASNNGCMLVGDVKQSIYRWRNSDWSILNNISDSKFHQDINISSLDTNFRSAETVVKFNNNFFKNVLPCIENHLKAECVNIDNEYITTLYNAYADVEQNVSKKNIGKGFVSVESYITEENDDVKYRERILEQMTQQICDLLDSGLKADNIAILARTSKDISQICDYLNTQIGDRIKIVSNEAFKLCNSSIIEVIICALRVLIAPKDHLTRVILTYKYLTYINFSECDKYNIKQLCKSSTEELNEILPKEFSDNESHMCFIPLYELCERLCNIFSNKEIKSQDAYLFSFFDQLSSYVHDKPATIQSFIEYWEESMSKNSIPNTSSEGIKLMTIHKSKGLEFHTVFIPFCDWEMDPHTNKLKPTLWCEPHTKDSDLVPLVALSYGNSMKESSFYHEYNEEFLKTNVDNLNLIYVAFTRASQNLFIYTGMDNSKKTHKYTVYNLLNETVLNQNNDAHKEGTICTENPDCLIDKITKKIEFDNHPINVQFLQSNKSRNFISQNSDDAEHDYDYYINKGLVIHKIMESISSSDDIARIMLQLENDGTFPSKEFKLDIEETIHKAFSNPNVSNWFSDKWNVMNECNIIYRDEKGQTQSRRPDRVIFNNEETIVIDYKTGKQSNAHAEQIIQYIKLLKNMNYPNVHGFLWYMQRNDIVKIEDND